MTTYGHFQCCINIQRSIPVFFLPRKQLCCALHLLPSGRQRTQRSGSIHCTALDGQVRRVGKFVCPSCCLDALDASHRAASHTTFSSFSFYPSLTSKQIPKGTISKKLLVGLGDLGQSSQPSLVPIHSFIHSFGTHMLCINLLCINNSSFLQW